MPEPKDSRVRFHSENQAEFPVLDIVIEANKL
jgi:hypothetical protein